MNRTTPVDREAILAEWTDKVRAWQSAIASGRYVPPAAGVRAVSPAPARRSIRRPVWNVREEAR